MILIAFLFLIIENGLAQVSPDTLKAELDSVQINAIRSTITPQNAPLSLSLLYRPEREINSNAALTLDDISNKLPGLWINDRENYALGEQITIRGLGWRAAFGVRGIQVIMDDIPLTVADGQAMLTSVDPAFIRNIELIRGPASTYWGNSSGGVLYLSTFQGSGTRPALRVRSMAGSYGQQKQEVQYSHVAGNHQVSAYTSYFSEDGYRTHSSAKLLRSGIKGTVDLNDQSRLEYMGAFVGMPQAEHPSSLTASQAAENPRQANAAFDSLDAGKQVYQGQLGLNYYRDTELGFLTFTGYGIYRDLNNPLPFGVINVNRWAGGFRGTLERRLQSVKLKAGLETKFQFDDRKEYENDRGSKGAINVNQLEKVTSRAIFLTTSIPVGNLSILSGLRYDWITFSADPRTEAPSGSRTFQAFSPSIGASYRINTTSIYSNLSTSFEAPTTTELVNRPDGGNGFNPNLEPERTTGLELGAKGGIFEQKLKFDMALFHLWVQDLLFPYQLESNGPTFFSNQGETRHYGIESKVSALPFPHIAVDMTYNLTRAEFVKAQTLDSLSLKGKDVPGIAEHRIYASAAYDNQKFLFNVNYEWVSGYPVDNLNTARNDSYGVLDARVSLSHPIRDKGITIQPFLNVNNLLDTRYNGSVSINAFGGRYFEPAAGRNWQAGIAVEFY